MREPAYFSQGIEKRDIPTKDYLTVMFKFVGNQINLQKFKWEGASFHIFRKFQWKVMFFELCKEGIYLQYVVLM